MKKLTLILFVSIFISCGSNNEKNTTNEDTNQKTINTEKKWQEFTIAAIGNTMSEMKYDVENITVQEGNWVRIYLINEGIDPAMLHNIVFINFGTRKEVASQSMEAGPSKKFVPDNKNVIAYSDLAQPGETVILEFEAPKKGNYEFFCSYPGHAEIMRGYFFVK
tara:strand:- start:128 stop:619 length:492 start_codon:yes stop_codon:yes gene_type:complete